MKASTITDWIRRRLPAGSLARGVAVLAGGNALAQLIGIAAAPIPTRLYSPDHYGLAGVYTSLLGLLTNAVLGAKSRNMGSRNKELQEYA